MILNNSLLYNLFKRYKNRLNNNIDYNKLNKYKNNSKKVVDIILN